MAYTYNKLSDTINWAQAFIGYLVPTIGTNNEPAITSANNTGQTVCGAPLTWSWNRSKVSFVLAAGTQDYAKTGYTTFSVLEGATVQPAANITNVVGSGTVATMTAANKFSVGATVIITGLTNTVFNGTWIITAANSTSFSFASSSSVSTTADTGLALSGQIFTIPSVKNSEPLGESIDLGRPNAISVQANDNTGNITFRFLNVPDQVYNCIVTFQMVPPVFTATSTTWSPIPNEFSYIYSNLFLAELLEANDEAQRAQVYRAKGIATLLAKAEGLDEKDKQQFLATYLRGENYAQSQQLKTQQGSQARGI